MAQVVELSIVRRIENRIIVGKCQAFPQIFAQEGYYDLCCCILFSNEYRPPPFGAYDGKFSPTLLLRKFDTSSTCF